MARCVAQGIFFLATLGICVVPSTRSLPLDAQTAPGQLQPVDINNYDISTHVTVIEDLEECQETFNSTTACVPSTDDDLYQVDVEKCLPQNMVLCGCRDETMCSLTVVDGACTFSCIPDPEFTKELIEFEDRVVRHDENEEDGDLTA